MNENQSEPARAATRPHRRQHTHTITTHLQSPSDIANIAPPPANDMRDGMLSTFTTLARDVFCVLDEDLHCHYLSENWKQISGFDLADDLGEGFKSHIAPDHLAKLQAFLSDDKDRPQLVRFQYKHQNGQWHWCELYLGSIENGQYYCLIKDITEWVNLQSKLEKTRLEAELATKSRSEFLANMSHELRTPLNAILGFAQMMEAGTYGDIGHPKYNDYIGSIQQSGTTLLSKVNDLLEIAALDAGKLTLNEEAVDVGQAIRQAIEFHSHRAFCEQVTLRNHLSEQPILVKADRIRLLQVITNLVANAIAHSYEGSTVDVFCTQRNDGGINISVKDTGAGIAPSHLESILDAFKQENSFYGRNRDCVGLGLALSKEIVKLHHGRITIDSKQGEGTLITVRLPRERTLSQKRAKLVEPKPEMAVD